jgi:hypothetical protein
MAFASETVRQQVERLVQSKTFETSEVHRRLLHYLAEKTLSGEADRLKEYTVGLEAFGKPPTYDPKHDSIVRLQVGRLRQKLLAYYQTEANGDPIVVHLPKGAFKLSFEEASTRSGGPRLTDRQWILTLAAALAVTLIWAMLATVYGVKWRQEGAVAAEQWSPELEQLWAPFLQTSRPVLVCLGMPLFIRLPEYGFFRDPRTNDWQEVARSERMAAVRRLGQADILPWFAFTGAGEASAAALISKLLGTRKRDVLLTRSNLMSWQQVADSDVVFVGPPKFNQQLQAAALAQDIVVEANGVRNLKPQPGEPVFLEDFFTPGKQGDGETHAVISRTAGLSGVTELIVIGGNASSDTLAAAEWLTQPWRARELVGRLRDKQGRVPRHFQVVVQVSFKQGIPVQSKYVMHHVLAQ